MGRARPTLAGLVAPLLTVAAGWTVLARQVGRLPGDHPVAPQLDADSRELWRLVATGTSDDAIAERDTHAT